MKNWKSLILPGIFLVIILAGAVFAYTELTKVYNVDTELMMPGDTVALPTENAVQEPAETEPSEKEDKEDSVQSDREAAPDFTVIDGEGNKVSLSDFVGKPVIVNFWATWCGPCKVEMPYFDTAWQEYGDEIEFMMVNLTDGFQDTVDGVKEFIEDAGYTFPVYYDTEYSGAQAYGVYSIPMTIMVDAEGALYYGMIGTLSEEKLESAIRSLLADAN